MIPIHNKKITYKGKVVARKRVYTVFTVGSEDTRWKMYHCPDCRNPIAQYKGDAIMEVPGEAPEAYPFMVQCKNPKCGRKVLFKSSTEQTTKE